MSRELSEWDISLRTWLEEIGTEIMSVGDDSVDLGICTYVIRIGVDNPHVLKT